MLARTHHHQHDDASENIFRQAGPHMLSLWIDCRGAFNPNGKVLAKNKTDPFRGHKESKGG
jgi:hypothetical protein